ncbi:MAG: PIG-L family deacetylase [Acidobacteria bacterium]|nr:PIG-L family deacetylase [Acidobacteriota bacterium]
MKRREFFGCTLAAGTALSGSFQATAQAENLKSWEKVVTSKEDELTTNGYSWISGNTFKMGEVVFERDALGTPYTGKVLAAIQPHSDDIPLFSAGTVAKLMKEGYTGFLIRASNDEVAGPGDIAETIMANHRDNEELAKVMGFKAVFDLGYRNHRMDEMSIVEFRARLVFLFRALKVDTIISYDPWAHYEYHPDHYVTARAVEAAAFMAGNGKNYPEHLYTGLQPHLVTGRYYFSRGRPQVVNRVVDISSVIDRKVEANLVNKAQGPAGVNGSQLKAKLAKEGRKLPLLGNDDQTANRQYIKQLVLYNDKVVGKQYGVAYAEKFHYIGPSQSSIDKYVAENTVPL